MRLLTLGRIDPADVPTWVNAANAVLVPSEREGFGLATLEALACDVPVLATPVGIAPLALAGVAGTLCAEFDAAALARGARAAPRGRRSRASPAATAPALFSAARMAERVAAAWRGLAAGE